ncbi:hypothetical protein F2Q70_00040182, partial [Brassica cretica]
MYSIHTEDLVKRKLFSVYNTMIFYISWLSCLQGDCCSAPRSERTQVCFVALDFDLKFSFHRGSLTQVIQTIYSGRYNDFAKQLNVNGFKVYGIDWIGHGGSDGLHAYVPSLDYAVTDLNSFLEKVIAENPGLPCFCVGHSTGGAIILKAMLDPKIEAQVSGIVLTSPAVGVQPSHPIFGVIAPFLAFLIPRYQLSAAKKKIMPVSRDPEALLAKYSDPLVYTGFIRARTGYEILRLGSHLLENLNRIKVPFLVLHGTADTVTDPKATQRLYDEASSSDKSIKLFDGLLHDLLFEPERGIIAGVEGLEGQEELCFINNNGNWYKKESNFQYNNYQQKSYSNSQQSGYQPKNNQQGSYQPQQNPPP